MSTLRFQALKETLNRKEIAVNEPARRSEIFGNNVFDKGSMRQHLNNDAYKSVQDAIIHGSKLYRSVAAHVSTGMQEYAIQH